MSLTAFAIKGALYGAVLDCESDVYPRVHLFSTRVADVGLHELRNGRCITTGGTDIGCVADHIAKHHIRRAVIITDGLVGRARGQHGNTLRKAVLGVAFTPGYCTGDLFSDLCCPSVQLD